MSEEAHVHYLLPCRDIVELVTEYIEGGLDSTTRLRFEEHLSACPPCREYLAQMRGTATLARRLAASPLSPAKREDLMRAFRERTNGAA